MSPTIATQARIRDLNDAFRTTGPSAGRWMITQGVQAEGPAFVLMATRAVQTFDGFSPDNDPHGEHDFGSINLAGQVLFWKIDYYDPTLSYGSNDPSDPAQTARVLTIMLASDY